MIKNSLSHIQQSQSHPTAIYLKPYDPHKLTASAQSIYREVYD